MSQLFMITGERRFLWYHKVLFIEQSIKENSKKHRGDKLLCFYFVIYDSNPINTPKKQ